MAYSDGANNVFLNLSSTNPSSGVITNAQDTDTLNASGTTTIDVNFLVKAGDSESMATTTITVGAGSYDATTGTTYANTANGLISAINNSNIGLNATFATQAEAGVAGGGNQTGIEITGGVLSVGVDPSSVSTSGTLNPAGIPASELLTQGQSITLQTGSDAAVTIAINSNIDSLATLASAINLQDADVTATVLTNGDGSQSLSLSDKNSNGGALSVTTTSAIAAPISLSFTSGPIGAAGGLATGTLGFGNSVTSNADEVVAGSIVLSNASTPGANAITFVMDSTPASGSGAGTVYGSTFTVNGNTLGNLATAIAAELGVSTTVGSSGISITSTTSGTTLEEIGASSLTATPALLQTSNVAGVAATNGTDGSTTLTMSGNQGVGFVAGDTLTGSIVLTNGNADTPGNAMTFIMGNGGAGIVFSGPDTWTTSLETVGDLESAINDAVNGTGMSASLNPAGQIVLTSNTVGTTIAVANGALNNTLQDTADTLTVTPNASTPSPAAPSTGATVSTGVSEINNNAIASAGNDVLNGSIILTNGTTNYTFGMAGSGLVAGVDKFLVAGNSLTDLANEITAQDGASDISAVVNPAGTGLTFASTVTGISIGVNSSTLSDVSAMSFTTPASGSVPQYQSGVIALTDGGKLPDNGGLTAGSLTGSVTITNNGATDTFVMGGEPWLWPLMGAPSPLAATPSTH